MPDWGWRGLDPTNLLPAGERHVKYYYGTSQHRLNVEVGMSRGQLAPQRPEREWERQRQEQAAQQQ